MEIRVARNLPKHPEKKYARRLLSKIKRVVVHHTAADVRGTEDDVRAIARYHVERRGWPGIGYHYVIARDGTIWKVNELRTVSYHVAGHNIESVGVCLAGNLNVDKPTQAQEEALKFLLAELRRSLRGDLEVTPHKDLNPTECPGRYGVELASRAATATA